MQSNRALAGLLRDSDPNVRSVASNAIWWLWFRADTPETAQLLQRLTRMGNRDKALAGLDGLIRRSPTFAEAYNQRAILYFRCAEYLKSIADCRAALRLNPFHFGAHSGMAQSYMKLRKPRAALRAFRMAFRINPSLQGVRETIRALEDVLGEGGKKDDKK
jgi:tetratricopeptide (TPR) repeat protein